MAAEAFILFSPVQRGRTDTLLMFLNTPPPSSSSTHGSSRGWFGVRVPTHASVHMWHGSGKKDIMGFECENSGVGRGGLEGEMFAAPVTRCRRPIISTGSGCYDTIPLSCGQPPSFCILTWPSGLALVSSSYKNTNPVKGAPPYDLI